MELEYRKIAAELLDCQPGELHFSLCDALQEVSLMLQKAGEKLRSKQAIATIIYTWRLRNKGEDGVGS